MEASDLCICIQCTVVGRGGVWSTVLASFGSCAWSFSQIRVEPGSAWMDDDDGARLSALLGFGFRPTEVMSPLRIPLQHLNVRQCCAQQIPWWQQRSSLVGTSPL